MATRVVTGPLIDPEGAPWPLFDLTFRVHPATYTASATVPYGEVSVTTDEAGDFAVTLITGIKYEVRLTSAFITRSSSNVIFPQGTVFAVVVPAGEGPISLAELQALGNVPVTSPQAATIINQWLATHAAELEALVAPTITIGEVTSGETAAAQITGSDGAYTLDLTLQQGPEGDEGPVGPPASWGTITGTLSAQTDLQAALDAKPNVSGDGSASTASRSDHAHGVSGQGGSMAVGPGASVGTTGGNKTAIGFNALANATSTLALGPAAKATANNATALGETAEATAAQSIAIGRSAKSTVANTAVIKANDIDIQQSAGTGVTRIKMRSPDGTAYWLSIANGGTVTVTAA